MTERASPQAPDQSNEGESKTVRPGAGACWDSEELSSVQVLWPFPSDLVGPLGRFDELTTLSDVARSGSGGIVRAARLAGTGARVCSVTLRYGNRVSFEVTTVCP